MTAIHLIGFSLPINVKEVKEGFGKVAGTADMFETDAGSGEDEIENDWATVVNNKGIKRSKVVMERFCS